MHSPSLRLAWVYFYLWLPPLTYLGLHTISAITDHMPLGHLLSH